MTDLSKWPTEAEAAAVLECSVKTIQRYAEKGKLEMRKRPVPGRRPENVCNPRDVDRLLPAAFVTTPGNGASNEVEKRVANPQAAAAFAFLETISTAVQTHVQTVPKPWLTLDEAAQVSGLTRTYIRDRAQAGDIASCRGGAHGALLVNRASLLEFRG